MAVAKHLLLRHERDFDTEFESEAAQQRAAFLQAFPLRRLRSLTIQQYVIGTGRPTFCAYVEPKTIAWANILGATATKFGMYHGRTRSDSKKRYRWVASKFGPTRPKAFANIKQALLELVASGKSLKFREVDENTLSPMFKGKILSLYFPDRYINICSKDHLAILARRLGIRATSSCEQQHQILRAKLQNPITSKWSNPKYMTFLYNSYIRPSDDPIHLRLTEPSHPPKVNVEEMLERWKRIGKISENFAFEWERNRLRGLGFPYLVDQIRDCRDTPQVGCDFISHSEPGKKRYIEVKTAGINWKSAGFRFFLSQNEYAISKRPTHSKAYYFYLVFYRHRKPYEVQTWLASDMYRASELGPNGYIVAFNCKGTVNP